MQILFSPGVGDTAWSHRHHSGWCLGTYSYSCKTIPCSHPWIDCKSTAFSSWRRGLTLATTKFEICKRVGTENFPNHLFWLIHLVISSNPCLTNILNYHWIWIGKWLPFVNTSRNLSFNSWHWELEYIIANIEGFLVVLRRSVRVMSCKVSLKII